MVLNFFIETKARSLGRSQGVRPKKGVCKRNETMKEQVKLTWQVKDHNREVIARLPRRLVGTYQLARRHDSFLHEAQLLTTYGYREENI